MSHLFTIILYQPIFNLLVVIYNTVPNHDFGVAIVLLTIIIRLLFSPLSIKALRSQKALSKIQPKIKEIQEKHKGDSQAIGQASMNLYKEHGVNPFSGCLPLLLQIPVLIALYQALRAAFLPESLSLLYSSVHNPGSIEVMSLGFINLAQKNYYLPFVAGILQWLQARQGMQGQSQNGSQDATASAMNKQLLYIFPIMIVFISWSLPTGLVLYWITTTLFSLGEQLYIRYRYS
jgi:YidC/Oxa1 family membrane protein insertase